MVGHPRFVGVPLCLSKTSTTDGDLSVPVFFLLGFTSG